MTDTPAAKVLKSTLIAGAAAAAAFAGFAAAPALFSDPATAQPIAVAPPRGAPMSFADLVERVSPAVVSIAVRSTQGENPSFAGRDLPPELEEFLRRFPQQPERPRESTSLGSGFFIDARGTIVTNHHVVDGASEILVRTSTGDEYRAEVIGSDELSDIAVLRLTDAPAGTSFRFVSFDEDARLRVGDWVVAVGNPFGLEGTATAGIVSAIGRRDVGANSLVDFIQTDAPINRGNSGGPTFDLYGRVVGVNSAIFSPTGGNVGIGFAIPASTADRVVKQLLAEGRVTRGWLGVQVQPMDRDLARSLGLSKPTGALVASVIPGSPAADAGVRQGDLILRVNGEEVENQGDLTRKVAAAPVGAPARFDIQRDGRRQTLTVRLGERPSQQQLAGNAQPEPSTPDAPGEVRQASLGVEVRPVTEAERRRVSLDADEQGLVITGIEPGSELARKAVRRGDVIVAAGDRAVRTPEDLQAAVTAAEQAGLPVRLQIVGPEGRRFVAANISADRG